jgi:hypothetical protein
VLEATGCSGCNGLAISLKYSNIAGKIFYGTLFWKATVIVKILLAVTDLISCLKQNKSFFCIYSAL